MKVKCSKCGAKFKLHESKIPAQGLRMECPRCGNQITVSKPASAGAVMPETGEVPPPMPQEENEGVAPPPPPPDIEEFDLGLGDDDFLEDFSNQDDLGQEFPPMPEPETEPEPEPEPEPESDSEQGSEDLESLLEGALGDMEDEFPLEPQEDDSIVDPPANNGDMSPESEEDLFADDLLDMSMEDEISMEAPPIMGDAPGEFKEAADDSDDSGFDIASLLEGAASEVQKEMEEEGNQKEAVDDALPDFPVPESEQADVPDQNIEEDLFDLSSGPMVDLPESDLSLDSEMESEPELESTGVSAELLNDLPDFGGEEHKPDLYYIRHGGGKVLGPFPEKVIIEMLETSKLNGKEEIKSGDDKWRPIDDVAQFKAALEKVASSGRDAIESLLPEKGRKKIASEDKKRLRQDAIKSRRRAGSLDIISPKKAPRKKIPLKLSIPLVLSIALLAFASYMQFVEEISVIDLVSGTSVYDLPMVDQLKSRHRSRYNDALDLLNNDSPQSYADARDIALDMLKGGEFRGSLVVNALVTELDYTILHRYGGNRELSTEAQEQMDLITKEKKKEPEFLLAQASKEFWRHDYTKARELLQKILIQRSQDTRALQIAAETFLHLPDNATAKKYLDTIIQSKGENVRTYYLLGQLEALNGNAAKAEAHYKNGLKLNPKHLDTKIELAGLKIKSGNAMHRAERDLRKIEAEDKANLASKQKGRIHFYLAQIYEARKEPYKVVKELMAAADQDPTNPKYNRELADFYFSKREYDKASEQYEKCVQNNEMELDCHIGLGRNYLAMNRPDKALFKLETATKMAPENAELSYLTGKSLEGLFQPEKALAQYQKAIRLDPNGVAYYTAAATIFLSRNDLPKAGEFIQKAKLIDANSPLVHNFLGLMHRHQKEMDLAEDQFRKAITANGKFVEAHLNLADVYRGTVKYPAAIAEYQEVLSLDEKNDKAYFGLGQTYFEMKEVDKSIAEYEKALGLNKNNYNYFYHAGLAYFTKWEEEKPSKSMEIKAAKIRRMSESGKEIIEDNPEASAPVVIHVMLKKALEAFTKASELSPTHPDSPHWIGRCYLDMAKFEKANEYYERALSLAPENPYFIFHYGFLFERQGRQADAIEQYDRALKIKKDYGRVYLRKGIILRKQNKYILAIKMFRKATKYDSSINVAKVEMGDCYFELGQTKKALAHYKEAIEVAPDDPRAHFRMGKVFMEMRKFKDAIKHFNKSLEAEKDNSEIYLKLGWANKRVKRYSDARGAFQRYLELEPQAIDRTDIEQQIQYLKGK